MTNRKTHNSHFQRGTSSNLLDKNQIKICLFFMLALSLLQSCQSLIHVVNSRTNASYTPGQLI